MTKAEREELRRILRAREKVQKSAAAVRSAELLADFENTLASEFSFDDDAVWEEAQREAAAVVAKASATIAVRCQELGIPARFAPGLSLGWRHNGYDNAVGKRRSELRRVAQTRIEALERAAILAVETSTVEALTRIAVDALESEAARAFIAALPTVEAMMEPLSYEAIAGPADPPVVEQLVSPGALRQQRHRDRVKALRNADVTSPGDA
ncbi:hypothetical protein [Amaricoccus sp.]|uniref:hypothetical protein n=1 Tax=Amaricoccus sp. TaxID=1872485 RepID=UPI001B3D7502|nr:hypothetical protein [Amaricoccus sp.]MBP7002282.1 hypothetical protein [Amaricoccus sp.]